MDIEKFLGSKVKTDILKYLLFRRQGISMRALEHDLDCSFPAIKKQVDSLKITNILRVEKEKAKRSIYLDDQYAPLIKHFFQENIKIDMQQLIDDAGKTIEKSFLGKLFGSEMDVDLVIIYTDEKKLKKLKDQVTALFKTYLIEYASVVYMSTEDFQTRYKLADKFVLGLMSQSRGS